MNNPAIEKLMRAITRLDAARTLINAADRALKDTAAPPRERNKLLSALADIEGVEHFLRSLLPK